MMAKAAAKKGRRRKKGTGRPPFPPPRRPSQAAAAAAESLRNLRPRRRGRPLRDYSEFDSDGFHGFDDGFSSADEEEDRGRRKLKLVLKLPHIPKRGEDRRPRSPAARPLRPPATAGGHASSSEEEEVEGSSESFVEDEEMEEGSEEEEEEAVKPPKKRKIDGYDDGVGSDGSEDPEKRRNRVVPRSKSSASGLSSNSFTGTPMPERKTLEEILDKLQKKDKYGVFAEPVDPEELPDYHDVIRHPMDFGTVRRKLASVAYGSFEQFEDDVFLICSNAMQYNAPDTIYFRQAHSIQDMARKNFRKLRDDGKCVETVLKSEEKIRFNSMEKKPLKKSLSRSAQESLGSDISSAATFASAGDACTRLSTPHVISTEAAVAVNGTADSSASLGECKSEKVDELSAKGPSSKLGLKQFVVDENRRATYDISDQQPEIESDALFDVLEGETKQLVAVGLVAEYSYARSLARFAASLGPVAWEIASKKIEKALPAGVKFGRGWVGEYEPLLTPVLSFDNHTRHQPEYSSNSQVKVASRKDKKIKEESKATKTDKSKDMRLCHKNQKIPKKPNSKSNFAEEGNNRERTIELEQRFGVTAETLPRTGTAMLQQQPQEQVTIGFAKAYTNVSEQARVLSSLNTAPAEAAFRRPEFQFEVATSRSAEIVSWDRDCVQPEPLKLPQSVTTQRRKNVLGMEPVGKVTVSCDSNRQQGFISKRQSELVGSHEKVVNDQSILGDLSSKMFFQSNISKMGTDCFKQFTSKASPSDRENLSTAASTARAWMSIGDSAGCKSIDGKSIPSNHFGPASFFGSARKSPGLASGVHEDSKVRSVPQVFRQPSQVTSEETHIHSRGLVIFPQLVGADLSRFHDRSQWHGLVPHSQQKPHKDMLPPDLNIGFQSPGSPVRQSSGVLMDTQQPDLALQL